MRILTISNCPIIESQGSGYVIVNFANGLRQKGHEIDLFEPNDYEPLQFLRGRANQYRRALGMLFLTLNQINKKDYDVIEFYGAEAWLIVSLLYRFKHCPYLIVSHSNGLETRAHEMRTKYTEILKCDSNPRRWYHINPINLFSKYFKEVDGIVTVSEIETDYAVNRQYQDRTHILTIENSLSSSFLQLDINFQRKSIIGYCGSWLSNKGVTVIKNDIPKILKEFPKTTFILIGVSNNFNKEEHFPIETCNRIEVIPFIDNKEILRQIYQTISIFIMPSFCESFGLVSAEAMACGCALVANKTGFPASLKHGEEGIILNEPTAPYLYEGIKQLLLDESLRLKIAKNGYLRVQSLQWDLAIKQLEKTYLEWIEEKAKFYESFN